MAGDGLAPAQVTGNVGQRAHGEDVDALDQRGFGRVAGGDEEAAEAQPVRHARHGQHAVDVAHAAIQAQLAQQERVVQLGGHLARGRQDAQGNGQVVGRAFLAQVGRRQVDGETVLRIEEAAVGDGGAHALTALAHGGVGQADERHLFKTAGNVDLDMDGLGIQPDHGTTVDLGKHGAPFPGSEDR